MRNQERDALRVEAEAAMVACRQASQRAEVAEVEADARVQALTAALEEERVARRRSLDENRRLSEQIQAGLAREQVRPPLLSVVAPLRETK